MKVLHFYAKEEWLLFFCIASIFYPFLFCSLVWLQADPAEFNSWQGHSVVLQSHPWGTRCKQVIAYVNTVQWSRIVACFLHVHMSPWQGAWAQGQLHLCSFPNFHINTNEHCYWRVLSSGSSKQSGSCYLLGSLFHPEDGGNIIFQNISKLLPDYRTSNPRWQYFSQLPLAEHHM
jgi:hypothetical protein